MFSVVCDKDIKPESIKSGEKIYLDTTHFLPFTRFIQKKGEKGANKGGNQKGKGGNFNRGGRGGKGIYTLFSNLLLKASSKSQGKLVAPKTITIFFFKSSTLKSS